MSAEFSLLNHCLGACRSIMSHVPEILRSCYYVIRTGFHSLGSYQLPYWSYPFPYLLCRILCPTAPFTTPSVSIISTTLPALRISSLVHVQPVSPSSHLHNLELPPAATFTDPSLIFPRLAAVAGPGPGPCNLCASWNMYPWTTGFTTCDDDDDDDEWGPGWSVKDGLLRSFVVKKAGWQ